MVDEGAHVGPLSKLLVQYEEATKTLIGADAFESALGRGSALTIEEVRSLITDAIPPGDTESV
jgi:hypothetical protein